MNDLNTNTEQPGMLGKVRNWFSREEKNHADKEWARDKHGKAVVEHILNIRWKIGLIVIIMFGCSCYYSYFVSSVIILLSGVVLGFLWSEYQINKSESRIVGNQLRYQWRPSPKISMILLVSPIFLTIVYPNIEEIIRAYIPSWNKDVLCIPYLLISTIIYTHYVVFCRWLLQYEKDNHLHLVYFNENRVLIGDINNRPK